MKTRNQKRSHQAGNTYKVTLECGLTNKFQPTDSFLPIPERYLRNGSSILYERNFFSFHVLIPHSDHRTGRRCREGRPAVLTVFGWAASFPISPPHSCRVPLRTLSPPRRPPNSLLRSSGGGFQMTKGHPATTTPETLHFRPQPSKLQVPAAPAQGPPSPTSSRNESQNSPRDASASK